jgi:hypothetical protein
MGRKRSASVGRKLSALPVFTRSSVLLVILGGVAEPCKVANPIDHA